MGDKKNQINGVVDRNINGLDQHHRHESSWLLHQDQAGYRSTRSLYPAWDTGRAEELFGDEACVCDEDDMVVLELSIRTQPIM